MTYVPYRHIVGVVKLLTNAHAHKQKCWDEKTTEARFVPVIPIPTVSYCIITIMYVVHLHLRKNKIFVTTYV